MHSSAPCSLFLGTGIVAFIEVRSLCAFPEEPIRQLEVVLKMHVTGKQGQVGGHGGKVGEKGALSV